MGGRAGSQEGQLAHVVFSTDQLRPGLASMAWTDEGQGRLAATLDQEPSVPWFSRRPLEDGTPSRPQCTINGYCYRSWEVDGSTEAEAELARVTLTSSESGWQLARTVLWRDQRPGDQYS